MGFFSGTYFNISKAINFSHEGSGTLEAPIVYKGAEAGKTIFSSDQDIRLLFLDALLMKSN